jgi:hypothetical protein
VVGEVDVRVGDDISAGGASGQGDPVEFNSGVEADRVQGRSAAA